MGVSKATFVFQTDLSEHQQNTKGVCQGFWGGVPKKMTFCVLNKTTRVVRPLLCFHTVTRFTHFGYAQAPTSCISKTVPPISAAAAGLTDKKIADE